MKRFVLIFVFTLCSITQSFGQFKMPKKEDFELVNKLPIVVLLKTEKDENDIQYNKFVKKYVEEFFGAERVHAYLNFKEFNKFIKDKSNKNKFSFIGYEYVINRNPSKGLTMEGIDYVNVHQIFLGICGKNFMTNYGYLSAIVYPDGQKNLLKKKEKFTIDESLMKFALTYFKNQINDVLSGDEASFTYSLSDLNKNASNLKNLTLLVDKNIVDEKFLEDLKKNYSYKFEIVDSERIKKAILENENGVAFFHNHFQPMASRQFANLLHVYQASDLKVLYFTLPENVGKFQIGKPKLIVDDRKDYIEKLIKEITK